MRVMEQILWALTMPDPNGNDSIANADICLLETGNFADATIVCADRIWNVHKIILGSRCKWFERAFFGNVAVSALTPDEIACKHGR